MVVKDSPIQKEIDKIINSDYPVRKYYYIGILHTEVDDINITKVISLDVVRDYEKNFADYIRIAIKVPRGVYSNKIYPFKSNLEFTLYRIGVGESNPSSDDPTPMNSSSRMFSRYKAILDPSKLPQVTGQDSELHGTQSQDILELLDIEIQLVNRSLEPLRIKTVGGVYKDFNIKQFLTAIISTESNKILVDGKPILDSIDIELENLNKDTVKDLIIPHGTHLYDLPAFLQNKGPGLYSSGAGNYFQTYRGKKTWFVYPLYNTDRFNTDQVTMIFYNVPRGMPFIEKTFRYEGNTFYCITTGDIKYNEDGESMYMNKGSGVRSTEAKSFMLKPVILDKEGPKTSRVNLNVEVTQKDRKDNLNYGPVTKDRISSNPLKDYTEVCKRSGSLFTLQWDHGDFMEFYPGMPCKVVYLHGKSLREVKGVILHIHAFSTLSDSKLISNSHHGSISITVFSESQEEINYENLKNKYVVEDNNPVLGHLQLPSGLK